MLDGARPLSAAEHGYLAARQAGHGSDSGYAVIQSTRPDTLAAALADSPSGLAAWLVEKYRAWSGPIRTRPVTRADHIPCYTGTGRLVPGLPGVAGAGGRLRGAGRMDGRRIGA